MKEIKNIIGKMGLMSRMRFIGLGCRMLFILSFFHYLLLKGAGVWPRGARAEAYRDCL